MSPLDLENWDFLAIHRAFCCCVFSLSGFYTAARCVYRLSRPGQTLARRPWRKVSAKVIIISSAASKWPPPASRRPALS